MADPDNSTVKQRRPGFQPGQSGNPAGKPRGTRSKSLQALDAIGMDHAEAVVRKLVETALAGDVQALKALADRLWPIRRGSPVTFDLPHGDNAGTVTTLDAVLRQVANGHLSPEEGSAVVALVEARRRALETEELAERITALEARRG